MKKNINGFNQKKIVQGKWAVLGMKMTHLYNCGLALRIF